MSTVEHIGMPEIEVGDVLTIRGIRGGDMTGTVTAIAPPDPERPWEPSTLTFAAINPTPTD